MNTGKKELIDYVLDESFSHYVVYQKPEEVLSWETWLNDHPDEKEAFQQAREIISFTEKHKKQSIHEDLWKHYHSANQRS